MAPVLRAENGRQPRPGTERRPPHVVLQYKDALACIGKRRRSGIWIDSQRYQPVAVGDPARGGHRYPPGALSAATPAAKFLGFQTRQDSHTMQCRTQKARRFRRTMDPKRSRAGSSWDAQPGGSVSCRMRAITRSHFAQLFAGTTSAGCHPRCQQCRSLPA